jgi:hypothetical protein
MFCHWPIVLGKIVAQNGAKGENKMKRVLICLFAVYCLLGFSLSVSAAEKVRETPDKGVAAQIADDARDAKKEAVQVYKESKEAVIHDVNEIKENIPKDLKEAKDAAIKQSGEIKENVKQGLKEIKETVSPPTSKPKPDGK